MSAHCLLTCAAHVFQLGWRSRSIPASPESGILVFRSRRASASKSGVVLAADGLLLLALLERRERICDVGGSGARSWKWIPTRPSGVSLTALADFHMARNQIIPKNRFFLCAV